MGEAIDFDVVIAGGGFAGVECAKALSAELGSEARHRVALIAEQNFMVFQPMLAEVCGSSLSPRHVVNPIRRLCRGVTVLRGRIAEVDLQSHKLQLDAGTFTRNVTVGFKHLALGLGGIVDVSRVPGMPEHAFLMKNVGDALELRGTIIDRVEEASLQTDPEIVARLLTFVVVGGGYSGVETAGQILDLLKDLTSFYPRIQAGSFRVVLVHSGKNLLPEINPKLGAYTERTMKERGLEIILNARVTAMTTSRVYLGDTRTIDSHTVVSTVGNAPHPLLLTLAAEHTLETERGRIVTEPTLQVKGRSDLWAAGDCAAVPMVTGEVSPPTAQFASRQGKILGKNIARALENKELLPFKFTGLGELAAIGHRAAVADVFGLQFSGFIAWFLWRSIYLMKLPGVERKLRVMIDWTLDLVFPRDITLLRGKPTEVLQEMHLEAGDIVCRAGEPTFSFYIVKSGAVEMRDATGVRRVLKTGDHFGERALLQDHVWRVDVVATEPSTLVALSAQVFETIASASTSINDFFSTSAMRFLSKAQIETLVDSIPDEVKSRTVGEVMHRNVVAMRADMTVQEALQQIGRHPYNSFPLLAADGKPAGLLNQEDLYDCLKTGSISMTSLLQEITPAPFTTVFPNTAIPEAVDRLCRTGSRKLLVADADGKLAGILTFHDLFTQSPPPPALAEEAKQPPVHR